jgi:hypothetical protein
MHAGMKKILFRNVISGKSAQSSQIGIKRNGHL